MDVQVRLSAGIAQFTGHTRLTVTLTEGATVADLLTHLRTEYPTSAQKLDVAVPLIAGQYVTQSAPLHTGQEVAFLLPVAGGSI